MKVFIVLAVFVAGSFGAPSGYGGAEIRFNSYDTPAIRELPAYGAVAAPAYGVVRAAVPILHYSMDDDNYGRYNMQVETGDGSITREIGSLINGPEGAVNVKSGEFSYVADGQTFTTRWVADENGYRASGAHLPTPPPMPEEIRHSLEIPRVLTEEIGYGTPAIRVHNAYETAPIVRVHQTYAAPVVVRHDSYAAPAVRVEPTNILIKSAGY